LDKAHRVLEWNPWTNFLGESVQELLESGANFTYVDAKQVLLIFIFLFPSFIGKKKEKGRREKYGITCYYITVTMFLCAQPDKRIINDRMS
jgi:hypothetical protein